MTLDAIESWDPNLILGEPKTCRVYGDDQENVFAIVDAIDFPFVSQWRWSPKVSRGGKKLYLRRNVSTTVDGIRTQRTLFLHTVIIMRAGLIKPDEHHCLVDHIDGDSLNCRRNNLRWATHSMNARNRCKPNVLRFAL